MSKFDLIMLCLAFVVVTIAVASSFSKDTHIPQRIVKPVVVVTKEPEPVAIKAVEIPEVIVEVKKEEISKATPVVVPKKQEMIWSIDDSSAADSPSSAFPSMLSDVGDADAELAQAYTYENLQDSMLTSKNEFKEAMTSRSAWSRLGERSNPEVWEAQMEEMKKTIKNSGQTFDQFSENTWAPIPEQLASLWKDSEKANAKPEVQRSVAPVKQSKQGMAEAVSLIKDATQEIFVNGSKEEISKKLKEVLDSRKRGKVLGLKLPALTSSQLSSLATIEKEKVFNGVIRTIRSL